MKTTTVLTICNKCKHTLKIVLSTDIGLHCGQCPNCNADVVKIVQSTNKSVIAKIFYNILSIESQDPKDAPYDALTRARIKLSLQLMGAELITIGVVDTIEVIDIKNLSAKISEQIDKLVSLSSNLRYDIRKGYIK